MHSGRKRVRKIWDKQTRYREKGLINVNPRSTHSNTFSLQFTDSNNFRMSSNGDFRAIKTPEKLLQVCVIQRGNCHVYPELLTHNAMGFDVNMNYR